MEWLDNVAGPGYTSALLWTFAALILLVIVLIIIKLFRSLTFGTFVAGGRNRKTRLAVMDATAVDSQRRLVLVRRDDVEHLLLIGGSADIVVERDIRMVQRRPALTGDANNHEQAPRPRALEPQPAPRPAPQPRAPEQPAPAPRSAPVATPQPAYPVQPTQPVPAPLPPVASPQPAPVAQRPAPAPAPRPEPALPLAAAAPAVAPARQEPAYQEPTISEPQPAAAPIPSVQTPSRDDFDESLIKELESTFEETVKQAEAAPEVSLDDEMAKLLGELSNQKR
ncbi:flagellar biosynthesis protein FliO [Pseudaminobacter salicylatoxidans]|uniref:Flagellar biosynthesis protein FliO n=1 Tax=Pseudaminobacter salicylatoxidans TaxID=93369 RepID=A0A316C9V1_PSESE|nr:flagellar biosynthetic protein FliO [Pseudaminobacter salicylatoxidans]PWJ85943.1 flagellar biosynthesis protein FliO [Pseudaminobacter salicylatoxidans]